MNLIYLDRALGRTRQLKYLVYTSNPSRARIEEVKNQLQ